LAGAFLAGAFFAAFLAGAFFAAFLLAAFFAGAFFAAFLLAFFVAFFEDVREADFFAAIRCLLIKSRSFGEPRGNYVAQKSI
jgi:hypothetical protein